MKHQRTKTLLDDEKQAHLPRSAGEPSAEPTTEIPTPSNDETVERTKLQTIIIVSSLMLALFLSALDVTIVATAVPAISEDLNSSAGYVWIGAGYVLSNAAAAPLWGKLSDIWGRKGVLITTIAVFWVGSLLCGVAVSMNMLLAARAVQGIGGGGIYTLVNICIGDMFSVRERGFYYGLVGATWGVASAVGPVIGGVFSSQVSWRWCFYINLPLSGLGIAVLYISLKLHNPRTPLIQGLKALDGLGCLTVVSGTVLLLLGLEFGGVSHPWASAPVICLIVSGVLLLITFAIVEHRYAKYPIVPLGLFTTRSNIGTFITTFCHTMVSGSATYWLPLYFQGVLVRSGTMSGVYLLPFLMGQCGISAFAGFFIQKTGNYVGIISAGMLVATLGFGLFIDLPIERDLTKIILFQIVAGIGVGPNYQAPLIALQNTIHQRDVGSATSTYGFIRQLSMAISIVTGGIVFNNVMEGQQNSLIAALGPEVAQRFAGDTATSSIPFLKDLEDAESYVVRHALLDAIKSIYIVFTCVGGLGLVASFLIKQTKMSREHTEYKTGLQSLRARNNHDED